MPIKVEIDLPDGDSELSANGLDKYLAKFKLDDSLRYIGELSYLIKNQDPPVIVKNGISITLGSLAYISLKLIEHSNNHIGKVAIEDTAIVEAVKIWANIPEPRNSAVLIQEFQIRQNLSQYLYNEDPQYHLARYYALLNYYWKKNAMTSPKDINALYESITGFSIKEAMLFGVILSKNSSGGTIAYAEPPEQFYERLLKNDVDLRRQPLFFEWFAESYSSFRGKIQPPTGTDHLNKYRENPLLKKPLLIPEQNYAGAYLLPVPTLLHFAVTSGLFHLLGNKDYNDDSANFRADFGRVFEDYVYDQLSRITASQILLREATYGAKGNEKRTSDITIVTGNRAVLIEVKHSCLNLQSKLTGSLLEIQKSIKNNIVEGIIQLSRFRYNLKHSSALPALTDFKTITEFEHLIITNDNVSSLNDIIRDQAMEVVKQCNVTNSRQVEKIVPNDFHTHIMSISELELIVEVPNLDLFSFLKEKRMNEQSDRMDFDEYGQSQFGVMPHNQLLKQYYDDFKSGLQ